MVIDVVDDDVAAIVLGFVDALDTNIGRDHAGLSADRLGQVKAQRDLQTLGGLVGVGQVEAGRAGFGEGDQGYAQAMIDQGQLCGRGLGVTKDPVKAVTLYRKASGFPPSNFAAATLASADSGALPVDAKYGSTAEEISNQEITYQVARMAARKVLIVADSCYSGLLTQTVSRAQRPITADEKTNDYLIGMAHKQSRNVLTSGGLEPVLDGGGARNHSIFAAALIDVLQTNTDVITSEEIYDRLLTKVMSGATTVLLRDKDVPNPQQPQYSALDNGGHVYGDFLFVPKGPT